jgi:predicted metal-dependent peptidase
MRDKEDLAKLQRYLASLNIKNHIFTNLSLGVLELDDNLLSLFLIYKSDVRQHQLKKGMSFGGEDCYFWPLHCHENKPTRWVNGLINLSGLRLSL